MPRKTPLYDLHIKYGGTLVDFAGYLLPIQYPSGIIKEHLAVRQSAGLFDVSHMGELFVSGKDAEIALNRLLSNDIRGMKDGQVRYTLIPNERGGAVDDVLIYRYNGEKFMVVANASNKDKDADWIKSRLVGDVAFEDESDNIALIALQGQMSQSILAKIADKNVINIKNFTFVTNVNVGGIACTLSRTGYTGEDGFELYCQNEDATALYETILSAGAEFGLLPAGLGARDTLRLEAGMPLYGHELSEDILITEVGLNFAIKLQKEEFVGKDALIASEQVYTRAGAEIIDKGIAREGAKVYSGEQEVGYVTSGTYSPSMGKAIAVLRVKSECLQNELTAEVRGRKLKLKVVKLPFDYKNSEVKK
ncbi:MAG: glycine cleavage system aminomethyltransferase GcvT [Clostridia bacterium]